MGDFGQDLLQALGARDYPLEILAQVCALVFQTRAWKGKSPEGTSQGIWIEHHMDDFACLQCGTCCADLGYENDCTLEDYLVWQGLDRQDILERVMKIETKEMPPQYCIWMDPVTQELTPTCPWLLLTLKNTRAVCLIQDVKPEVCRQYPFTRKHARHTGCRGSFSSAARQPLKKP